MTAPRSARLCEAGDRVRKLLAHWLAEIAGRQRGKPNGGYAHANQRGRFENEAEAVRRAVWRLQEELEKRSIPLRVHAGMEIMASPETERLIREQRVLSLAGSRYYLLEFPFGEDPQVCRGLFTACCGRGRRRYWRIRSATDISGSSQPCCEGGCAKAVWYRLTREA